MYNYCVEQKLFRLNLEGEKFFKAPKFIPIFFENLSTFSPTFGTELSIHKQLPHSA